MNKRPFFGIFHQYQFLLVTVLAFAFFASCEKAEDKVKYSDITFDDITVKQSSMTPGDLVISDATGVYWKPGDLVVYKTSEGRYGKFEVVSINPDENYKLTFNATTYEANGSVHNQVTDFVIRGTWLCDLDEMQELGDFGDYDDFHNNRLNPTDTRLAPQNDAIFARYTRK